jgi:hypothetical protein
MEEEEEEEEQEEGHTMGMEKLHHPPRWSDT